VGGRLSINADYKAYRASLSDLEYIHVQVHGKPKLGTGGIRSSATVLHIMTSHSCKWLVHTAEICPEICPDKYALAESFITASKKCSNALERLK
jgi:hypothetical protein